MKIKNFFSIDSFEEFNNISFRKSCNKNLVIDRLTKEGFSEIIKDLSNDVKHRTYAIGDYKEYFRIKDRNTNIVRRVVDFKFRDFFLYYYLVYQLQDEIAENRVENTFGGFRFGNALKTKENEDTRVIEEEIYPTMDKHTWSKIYGEFNSILLSSTNDERYKYVAELDIANFYDNINLSLLEEAIRHKANNSKAKIISLLFYFLQFWDKKYHFYNARTAGIPQDIAGDASRLLANFYLQIYDDYIYKKCQSFDIKYIRYADDQVFFSNDQESLKKVVYLASRYLSKIHLNINNKKVFYGTIEQFKKKKFGITFYDNLEDMYGALLSSNFNNNPTLFTRGLKRLIALLNKEKQGGLDKYSKQILFWISQDNFCYLFSIKSSYELEYLKNVSEKLHIKMQVNDMLKLFARNCFDDYIVELIHRIWSDDDLRKICNKRIEEIKFLTTSDNK
ncbi:MAG: RNA-directed DNA polymerase [Rickettsiales bacterium]